MEFGVEFRGNVCRSLQFYFGIKPWAYGFLLDGRHALEVRVRFSARRQNPAACFFRLPSTALYERLTVHKLSTFSIILALLFLVFMV